MRSAIANRTRPIPDFPHGGEKRPHVVSLNSIWALTKGPICLVRVQKGDLVPTVGREQTFAGSWTAADYDSLAVIFSCYGSGCRASARSVKNLFIARGFGQGAACAYRRK